ncbi:hypothetical protein WICPIJ_006724 [Wickerhamomyces pijperi]|uniref:Uncharacterized protein n=1 Tax=Wickerhamomyces pijperi TaxID=599730 RepID=A0A9P8TKP6_WICPI|nr:hypothetical protein WICPIJ_006724 [Wickerhamomyces pijperi]
MSKFKLIMLNVVISCCCWFGIGSITMLSTNVGAGTGAGTGTGTDTAGSSGSRVEMVGCSGSIITEEAT